MKVLVVHDEEGNVSSVAVVDKGVRNDVMLVSDEGQSITEIDTSDEEELLGQIDEDDPEQVQQLTNRIKRDFRMSSGRLSGKNA